MEKYTMFMDRKNQQSEHEYTTQSNLQIQCNPIKILTAFLQNGKADIQIHTELQEALNNKTALKKIEDSNFTTSKLTQNYNN